MGEVDSKSEMDDPTTEMTSKPMVRKSTVDNVVLANATGNATSKLVLVPPPEASIVAIQRIFRGLQTRRKYDVLKVWEAELAPCSPPRMPAIIASLSPK